MTSWSQLLPGKTMTAVFPLHFDTELLDNTVYQQVVAHSLGFFSSVLRRPGFHPHLNVLPDLHRTQRVVPHTGKRTFNRFPLDIKHTFLELDKNGNPVRHCAPSSFEEEILLHIS
jgi:hypothetical protein